jgi:LPXTG-motif cell wall-anchored protein
MLLALQTYRVQPAGTGLERVPLWEYYADEIGRAFGPARPMGPATGGSGLGAKVLEHVLLSVAGGLLVSGIGWLVRRRGREPGPAVDVGSAET